MESGCGNVVTAAPCQADPQQYETQYSRLRSFLSGITDTVTARYRQCVQLFKTLLFKKKKNGFHQILLMLFSDNDLRILFVL